MTNPLADTSSDTKIYQVGAKDFVGYLLGARASIVRILRLRRGLMLATALVFSASLAREYDAVSLAHKPWDLVGSFGASILLCTIIYLFVGICLSITRKRDFAWASGYNTFLTGYWMTAPLAWLYAFPIETMASEINSLRFNLTALSIVSIWRVVLFSRVVSILYTIPFWCSLIWILVPCMAIAFYFLVSAIFPMVSIMGGIRMTETQAILYSYQNHVAAIIFYGTIPVLILLIVSLSFVRSLPKQFETTFPPSTKTSWQAWSVPAFAILTLITASLWFQPRLWRAERVSRMLASRQFTEAIKHLDQYNRDDFPEAWDPPPRFKRPVEHQPAMAPLLQCLHQNNAALWINDLLLVQADEIILMQAGWNQGTANLDYLKSRLPYQSFETLEQLTSSFTLLGSLPQSDPAAQPRARELAKLALDAIETKKREKASAEIHHAEADQARLLPL